MQSRGRLRKVSWSPSLCSSWERVLTKGCGKAALAFSLERVLHKLKVLGFAAGAKGSASPTIEMLSASLSDFKITPPLFFTFPQK
jgi:hypothetical protein